jgi:hypothetical protein
MKGNQGILKGKITKADIDKLAEEIGHFIMKFETMVEHLRSEIMHMVTIREIQDWTIIQILLADLTAEPILKKYEAMFHSCCTELKSNKEAHKVLKEIYDEASKVIQYRNKIAHAHWFIEHSMNWTTFEHEEARLVGRNQRIKRKTGVKNVLNHENTRPSDELKTWTEETEKIIQKILILSRFIGKCEKTKYIKFE